MASFNLTTFSSVARSLSGAEQGYIGASGDLAVSSNDAVVATADSDARLVVNGAVAAISGNNQHQAVVPAGDTFTLMVGPSGTVQSTGAAAVFAVSDFLTAILNDGSIQGAIDGVNLGALTITHDVEITNNGVISGGDWGIRSFGPDDIDIVNTGRITGGVDGMEFGGTGSPDPLTTLVNAGLVAGGVMALDALTHVAPMRVINTGAFVGDVQLGEADDVFRGGGTVAGAVLGGAGDDMLAGGAGADALDGGDNDDELRGHGGDDSLEGGGGRDLLRGGDGHDDLFGGVNNDDLRGHRDDDLLAGGAGNDRLLAGAGDDRLFGGAGRDLLEAGQGDDVLDGGAGVDDFTFVRRGGENLIQDFENGKDRIDLTDFGLRPSDFAGVVSPALSNAGGATLLDLDAIGGQGSVLIEGLAIADADASDFIL